MTTLRRARSLRALTPWLFPLALLIVWQASAQWGWLSTRILPAPSAVRPPGGPICVFHQRSARFVGDRLPLATLRALSTRAGGEAITLP